MLRLYNSLTHAVEPVEATDGALSLYVCGVTPYDTTHLGHAFTYVTFDALVRFLRQSGISVRYAQNVTDIDDDILRKADELALPYDELARRETAQYVNDMRSLNTQPPDAFVPATSVIPEIVDAVTALVEAGVGYASGGNVYFDASKFPQYGAAVGRDRGRMLELAAEHGGNPEDANKRDPLDFLLWQKELPGEPSWASPFGPGRPGWHIECTAIAMSALGYPIDIHGGGSDLIFPHHASEIAQAECLTGRSPFVRHWMNNAMVRMDGEKMSKSLGNMVFVRDLVSRYSADAIRLYLLSHHYRTPFEWNEAELVAAAGLAEKLAARYQGGNAIDSPVVRELISSIEDDFHTDQVVDMLADLADGDQADLSAALMWAVPALGLTVSAARETPPLLRH